MSSEYQRIRRLEEEVRDLRRLIVRQIDPPRHNTSGLGAGYPVPRQYSSGFTLPTNITADYVDAARYGSATRRIYINENDELTTSVPINCESQISFDNMTEDELAVFIYNANKDKTVEEKFDESTWCSSNLIEI